MKKYNDLTRGSVFKNLIYFALPYLFASLMQAFYGAVDLFTVGHFSGRAAISAVNVGTQIMQLVTSCVIGISMGSTVMLGQNIGGKKDRDAAYTVGNTIIVFGLFAVIITPVMIWQAKNLTMLMSTPEEAVRQTMEYVTICSAGIPFIAAYNVIAALLRGTGDSKTPMYFVGIACIVNIAGDFLLTGFFKMDVVGVAVATVAAQAISSVCGAIYLKRHGFSFEFNKTFIRRKKEICRKILAVGIPIALQDTLINISFMVLTVVANVRGLVASSAVGVVEKLMMFMFLVPSAMLSSVSAITAQNYGAGKKERAVLAVKYAMAITALFGAVVCAASWIAPDVLTGIFTRDSAVIAEAGEYLKTYSIDCILVAVVFSLNGYLCGTGRTMVTFVYTTVSTFLVRIPAAILLSSAFADSLMPMGLASPLGTLASILILFLYWLIEKNRNKLLTKRKK